ncbi:MAG: FAD-binding protein [Acidimicrobiia bacterium]|nr:FAD-binding protein [Acidimicrobiia bacterium]
MSTPDLQPARPLRVLALAKQIPVFEDMRLGPDNRLVRDGQVLHMNDYCRRGVAQGLQIARASGGTLSVLTLGPPSADTVCREAIAFGADAGFHVTDPAFAGSDTLATARALAAAVDHLGPFDLILAGRNSVDADTGQVPPQLAELLDLPFACGVRRLRLGGERLSLLLEHNDEWLDAELDLPALLSCAERLIDPCKIKDPAVWAGVDSGRIRAISTDELGPGPWGAAASPTSVGPIWTLRIDRRGEMLSGPVAEQADRAVTVLDERGAFTAAGAPDVARGSGLAVELPPGGSGRPAVGVLIEPARDRHNRELLGGAARLATAIGGHVVALGPAAEAELGSAGADAVRRVIAAGVGAAAPADGHGELAEEDVATAVGDWAEGTQPWAILAPSTAWGREVASRVAARLGAGLTGDAVGLSCTDGRLIADKLAFGGYVMAAIKCSSAIQMATVRAGVLGLPEPRRSPEVPVTEITVTPRGRLRVLQRTRDDDSDNLANAEVVIGVGVGVDIADYERLRADARKIGAELCATRKVTDVGAMPRARQVGITGHTISPRLYIAIGLSGKFNHTASVRSSGSIMAVNPDPDAPIFDWCDVGFVADWRDVFDELIPRLEAALAS